jgi:hypothetical protein
VLKPKSSQAVDANTLTKQAEKIKKLLPENHRNCFLGQDRSADGEIQATWTLVTSEVNC